MRNYPHLDGTNMPSDPNGSLGTTRTALARAYNTSRTREDRMKLLRDTLVFMLTMIDDVDYKELPNYRDLVALNSKLQEANENLTNAVKRNKDKLTKYLKDTNAEEKANNKPARKRPTRKNSPRNKQKKDS